MAGIRSNPWYVILHSTWRVFLTDIRQVSRPQVDGARSAITFHLRSWSSNLHQNPKRNFFWMNLCSDFRTGSFESIIFSTFPPFFPALGYIELGLLYHPWPKPSGGLWIYIRRIPTIKSMESGEVVSSVGFSSNTSSGLLQVMLCQYTVQILIRLTANRQVGPIVIQPVQSS